MNESPLTEGAAGFRVPPRGDGDGGGGGDAGVDIQAIADRYGWSVPMARWWASCAACSVGTRREAVIAFLDRTVGGVTMIRRL